MKRKIRNSAKKVYGFQVIIKAPRNILDRIESVTYKLSPAWPNPIRFFQYTEENRREQFGLKELAWGQSRVLPT